MMVLPAGATGSTSHLIPTQAGTMVLAQLCQSILTAHCVTTSAAFTLIQQVPFQNGLLTTLPEDQALAGSHAQTFINGWQEGVANGLLQGLESIGDDVAAMLSEAILPLAQQLDSTSPTDPSYNKILTSFRSALVALQATATTLDPNSGSTLLDMQTLCVDLQNLSSQVGDDATRLATAVQEVNRLQPIQALTDKQQGLQNQLAALNATIASGATDKILPSIQFGIELGAGMLDPLESGVTAGAIAGSVLSIVGEGQEIAAYNQEIASEYATQKSLTQQISDLAKDIAADKTDMMTLSLTAAQIALFNAQITSLLKSAQGIVSQMSGWGTQIGALGLMSSPPSAGYFTAQVTDAQTFWSSLGTTLNRYLAIISASGYADTSRT